LLLSISVGECKDDTEREIKIIQKKLNKLKKKLENKQHEKYHVDVPFRRLREICTTSQLALDKINVQYSYDNRILRKEVLILADEIETSLLDKLHERTDRKNCPQCDSVDL